RVVGTLVDAGVAEARGEHVRLVDRDFNPRRISLAEEEERKAYERSRVEMTRGYAETSDCRRRHLLGYFGEEYPGNRCDLCDNDLLVAEEGWVRVEPEDRPDTPAPFAVGDRVVHQMWGEGTVQRVDDDALTVLFDHDGHRTLALGLVLADGLLELTEGS
ncbi:MAG TPA: RecQ family zinc-binding domain-containing protein, partial [Thermomicrobiaceae bacterium]|nr:RecQ family zinc-binding domain-containing protein [Thermomicrobiaceae bacterium]